MGTLRTFVGSRIKGCGPLYRQINRLRRWRLHEPTLELDHKVLGSFYGGWAVPDGYLHQGSIAYSVGVGVDISFDLALEAQFGCQVFALDPTPIAIEFMKTRKLPDRITFVPVGLSSHDGEMNFFTPQKGDPACFTKLKGLNDGEAITCETLTLASLMKRLHHDRIDLLKMDIEGFEYEVIEEMLSSRTLPDCLLVEFHHLVYAIRIDQTYRIVERLLAVGYQLFWVSNLGREYGFIRWDSDIAEGLICRNPAGKL